MPTFRCLPRMQLPRARPDEFRSPNPPPVYGARSVRRRAFSLSDTTCRRRRWQPEERTHIVDEQLALIGLGETDLVDELQAGRRIPARVIGAVHHMIDAIEIDSK